ncbi:mechanosensitive ion channel family protein [Sulfurimonas sp.]|uniref:mechanosensitive ion channel family protein n=1 Tax=Sulfurimonas sp. TaxID=2022749 RepID=UPI002B491935|nr:mechanosensitive ion channel domain-containing protein [Sulfurimonas sp.]
MKKIFFLFFLLFPVLIFGKINFMPFVENQLELIKEMNSENITQEEIVKIIKKQEVMYSKAINELLEDKERYLASSKEYDAEIFALKKVIHLNKRYNNVLAIVRDEILIKIYEILSEQKKMIKNILTALNTMHSYDEYQEFLNKEFVRNQMKLQEITNIDYKKYLELQSESKVLIKVREYVKIYYILIEVNNDIVKYLSYFDKKMYSLNEYSKYGLVAPIIRINEMQVTKNINSMLEPLGLSIIKILVIIFVTLLIYGIKKYVYTWAQSLLFRIKYIQKYSKDIVNKLHKSIKFIMLLINIEIVIYIYNDFISINSISMTFNVLYSFLFTYSVYKTLNTIVSIKILKIDNNSSIKNEIINVGIKIVNFLIWIIGFLLILYSAGVNLTAVLSGLGIGGFAIALAAKDSLANFFGTLSILLSDTFSQGDWIVTDNQEGTVVEIGLRVTTIRTFDNALISIPNANLANTDIKNWNKRRLGRRIKMSLGVKYDSKADDIRNAVLQIKEMLQTHPDIATDKTEIDRSQYSASKILSYEDSHGIKKTLLVYLDEFSSSSINILVYCFSKTVDWEEWLATKEDVMHQMMKILEKNNLEFAFPSMSIYHENEVKNIS